MEPLSSLHLLTEAVRNAGADIAPTYQEYIQLAFAIATDCGEAGRQDFLALCSLSSKYDHRAAEQLFNNALKTGHNDVHIGTAFHLAELCGVKIEYENPGTVGTVGTEVRPPSGTHTRTRVKEVYSQEKNDFSCEEETSSGSAPLSPLPTFDKNIRWPYPLEHIMSAPPPMPRATSCCWEHSTFWAPPWGRTSGAHTEERWYRPACRLSLRPTPHPEKESCRWYACW